MDWRDTPEHTEPLESPLQVSARNYVSALNAVLHLFDVGFLAVGSRRLPLKWVGEALDVIEATPRVTYQVLTKRPGNIKRRLADLGRRWPDNAWCGATIGHPKSLPLLKPLLRIDAPKRFLSVEPLLAPMVPGLRLDGIDWVIGGGESPGAGHPARPCDPAWMRAVRDLCVAQSVPFFLKQWGIWENNPSLRDEELDPDAKGGATLDGRLWREFPHHTQRRNTEV